MIDYVGTSLVCLVGWLVGATRFALLYSTGWLGSRQDGSDSMDGWMDGLVGALWCGGNLCVLAVGAAGDFQAIVVSGGCCCCFVSLDIGC